MDFETPAEVAQLIETIDRFIEEDIRPLEEEGDNARFFDHRREWARTDFDADGRPRPEWYALLAEGRHRADRAGLLRWALPAHLGGSARSSTTWARPNRLSSWACVGWTPTVVRPAARWWSTATSAWAT